MKRSPLHDSHQALGARFVDFGGWEMPVHYQSVLAEHRAVRTGAGVFDVSHLGRFQLTGPGARAALDRMMCNDLGRIEPGGTQYTMMLNDAGGIVDDIIVWWLDDERFWVLPNAANHGSVLAALAAEPGCEVVDLVPGTVFLAVQGPDAPRMLASVLGQTPPRFRTLELEYSGAPLAVAGTGYTGEKGGEICVGGQLASGLFSDLIDAGAVPCGLGSRDTLRLEAGLRLWGSDIDETTTPLEAGLDFAVTLDRDYVGVEALRRQSAIGVGRRLAGFVVDGRGVPRHGYPLRSEISTGVVTSGNLSPMLNKGIGLGYLKPPMDKGTIEVGIRDRWVSASVTAPPFHEE